MKINGTHQPLVYADDVNILGGSVHTVKEITEVLVVTCKRTGLEINADKTKYMVTSRDQNAGGSQRIKNVNTSCERVEHFKYLETNLMNQNSINEEIKCRYGIRECFLQFSAESFVLQCALQKYKD